MATITSNQVTVTVAGITYTYSLSLSASPTSLPSSGGTVTLTAVLSSSPSGGNISGQTITFVETTTGTTLRPATTDSSGTASITATLPDNTTTTSESYTFDATANPS